MAPRGRELGSRPAGPISGWTGAASPAAAGPVFGDFDFGAAIRLGRPNADTRRFVGDLDEVRLWDRPIAASEVIDVFFGDRGFANYPPSVDAGIDLRVQDASYAVSLDGQATDDGQPGPQPAAVSWTQVEGPAAAVFTDPSDPRTVVTFPQAGRWILELAVDDGVERRADTVQVDVFDPLPAPWSNTDIGSAVATGWATVTDAPGDGIGLGINGSGTRVGGNAAAGGDGLHFVHRELATSGAIDLVGRVDGFDPPGADPDARAGLMYRVNVVQGVAANAFVGVSGDGRLLMSWRSGSGGNTQTTVGAEGVTLPVWVRLRRTGTNSVQAFWSADGAAWTDLGERTVNSGGGVKYWGAIVCSGDANGLAAATVNGVRVSPDACPGDTNADGDVGFADVLAVLAAFGACPQPCAADLDLSGDVGFDDLLAVLAAFGPCP